MPKSPEDFTGLVFRSPDRVQKYPRVTNSPVHSGVGALLMSAFVAIIIVIPTFRTPVGPSHYVGGTVKAVGFGSRGRLIASVRLESGAVVRVRAPYSAELSSGIFVTLTEQPMRFGPPVYALTAANYVPGRN